MEPKDESKKRNDPDRKADHHRNQMIYDKLDPMSKEQLIETWEKLKNNYNNLFDSSGRLKDEKAVKLERLYAIIDIRIVENLKLWRE